MKQLEGRVLFVFSDPGGAKPCLALIEEYNLKNVIALSDRQYHFYDDFKTKVIIASSNFEKLVDSINPDIIFTGTSYTSEIEKQFIRIARNRNIVCVSFVDHWTSMLARFQHTNHELLFPDQVWVIDERAKQIAIEEGIDKDRINISGNPYHNWLKKWKPLISKDFFYSQIGLINSNKKILLYAPDPLSNVDGISKFGFNEITATKSLIKLFDKYQTELNSYVVFVKAHPNQNRKKLENLFKNCQQFYLLPEKIDTNTIIYFSDIVIGFFSSLLIEASILGKPVLRYFYKQPKYDPFMDLNVGTVVNNHSIIKNIKIN